MSAVMSARRREREVVQCFLDAGATGAASAKRLVEMHVRRGTGLRRLLTRATVREVPLERFYLDEDVWAATERTRRRLAPGDCG
ncbi:MAG: hypothetical protein ABJC89_18690, partial [Acidobacteriota bacterium]